MIRFVIAYAAVWPILVNTVYGVRGGDRMLYDVASHVGRHGRAEARSRDASRCAPEHRHRDQGGRRDRPGRVRHGRVRRRRRDGIGAYMQQQRLRTGFRSCTPRSSCGLLGYAIDAALRAASERRACSGSARSGRGSGERRGCRARRRSSAALVFAAALALWEAWARSEGSFLLPPRQRRSRAAWDVWPTPEFLAQWARA